MTSPLDPQTSLSDNEEDIPIPGPLVVSLKAVGAGLLLTYNTEKPLLSGSMDLPAIVFGAGVFSAQYNTDDHVASTLPLRTVRLALR
jgi:hypothetical protein